MNNELVSIILPVYKADRLTENCIKSVLLQDYENMELLIIENGAFKSDLEERIKEFTNSDKIRYFNEKMANVSKARNYKSLSKLCHFFLKKCQNQAI